jgi:deoxyadenosine/deoxycytidine kinase
MIIIVDGLIAAGKSSLLKTLKESFDCQCIYEPVDHWKESGNLERFYNSLAIQDPENRSAQIYRFQTYVFQTRIKRIMENLSDSKLVFIERSIFSDRYIFMEMLYDSGMVTEDDYKMYINWWTLWEMVMPVKPDAFIYLNPSIEACLERYHARNRDGETIDKDYEEKLQTKHDEFFQEMKLPYLNLKTDVDFRSGDGKKYVVDKIREFIGRVN